jgi:hypothetical protein
MNALTINSELQKHLVSKNPIHDGVQYKFKFANNYGASIVCHKYSYGSDRGLWELAVLDKEDHLCYNTDIADGVLGFLTEEDVLDALWRISNLL